MEDFAVYARGVTPDGPYKNGPGEINTTVVCGGRVVNPGDIVLGDEDGVILSGLRKPRNCWTRYEKYRKMREKYWIP